MMRWVIVLLAVLVLGACEDSVTVRYKVIVQAEVDGKIVEGSSVMEMKYRAVSNSALGYGGATEAKGEATVLDLGKRGKLFVLPASIGPDGGVDQFYETALLSSLGLKGGVGALDSRKLDTIAALRVGYRFELKYRDRRSGEDIYPPHVRFLRLQ